MPAAVAEHVAAIVLAAGLSSRMGQPKMILPWGDTTVIGRVVQVLRQAGLVEIVAVTGGARPAVEQELARLAVQTAFNPRFAEDQMAYSLQAGLAALGPEKDAVLIVLGDQPQIQVEVTTKVLQVYQATRAPLVIPSYQMRRGHPWLVRRSLWPEIMQLELPCTLRDVIKAHAVEIHYLPVATDTILRDLDTLDDYTRERP